MHLILQLMELNMLALFIQKTTCASGEIGEVPKENEDTADSHETLGLQAEASLLWGKHSMPSWGRLNFQ